MTSQAITKGASVVLTRVRHPEFIGKTATVIKYVKSTGLVDLRLPDGQMYKARPENIDEAPLPEADNPAPTADPVETLLRFIESNASEEVFEKAQALELLMRSDVKSHKDEAKEWEQELSDLKEELTDGHGLSEYVSKLGKADTADLVSHMMDFDTFHGEAKTYFADDLMEEGSRYLKIPLTNDAMDEILHDQLEEAISRLGVEEALRLLNA